MDYVVELLYGVDLTIHASFSDLFWFTVIWFTIWSFLVGYLLYSGWERDNLNSSFSAWCGSYVGKNYLISIALLYAPITIILVLLSVLLGMVAWIIDTLNKARKF